MQWLGAILAFATTMLIFAVVVSAIVETIHRALGSRTFGLLRMLEHYYDDVLSGYIPNAEQDRQRFLESMVRVRAPSVIARTESRTKWGKRLAWTIGFVPRVAKSLYAKFSGTSEVAATVGHSHWQLLTRLPVETFMERLGSSEFPSHLEQYTIAVEGRDALKGQVLNDIAQKFTLYGEEASHYFETKARTISVVVALFVAWIFYVHPYDLIQTYLQNPAVAAKVSELGEDTLDRHHQRQKETLTALQTAQTDAQSPESADALKELIEDIRANLAHGQEQVELLTVAGAPIGWPEDAKALQPCSWITLYYPNALKDVFWLLIGGLFIGLGAPFWAKTIAQLTKAKGTTADVLKILTPSAARNTDQQITSGQPDIPVTSMIFRTAAEAKGGQSASS